jgi:uncharacterized membrane protein
MTLCMIQFTHMPEVRWWICGAVAAAVVVFCSYYWAKGRSRRWLRMMLAGLRAVIIAGIVICLLNPEWVEAIKHQSKSRVAVLLDTSRSMATQDVPAGRLAASKNWLKTELESALPDQVEVDYYTFDQSLAPMRTLETANPQGSTTGLANALDGLLALPKDDPLIGVVLCSDGIENQRRDPEAVAKVFRRKGIPIHTVAVGTTNDVQDVIIENVQVKRAVPNQAPAKVSVIVRSFGYADRTTPVQILRSNQVVATQQVRLKDGSQRFEMDFVPRQKGFQVYEVSIPTQKGEWLATNNRRRFGLEVIDPTIRVIYMEGTPQHPGSPIPEWKYLMDALQSDPNIKVKTLYRKYGATGQFLNTIDTDPETGARIYPVEHPLHGFPRTLDALLEFDVIIHSDIRTQSFSKEQLQNMARLVEEFGGGFVMIGGNSAFGKGGYHRTILDRIIPVAMEKENDSHARSIRLRVPPAAYAHPLMALGATPQETELIWTRKFPVLYGCNLVDRAKPGAVVLGEDPASRNGYGPRLLLAVQSIGKGRSMAFTADTTRSWGKDFETLWGETIAPSGQLTERNCDGRYYRQFWVNAVRWLAAGRLLRTNQPVALELTQSYCLPNEHISATITVRDKEHRLVATNDVVLNLSAPGLSNLVVKATLDRVSQTYHADIVPPAEGDYIVTAAVMSKGQKMGDDRQLLVCESADVEMADLRARPGLMANIARASGGQSLAVKEKGRMHAASIFGSLPPVTLEYRRTPLWDRFWWLGLLLVLLTVEWSVRRLNGMA